MHFHYGLGVGHVYSHEARIPECPCSAQEAPHPVPQTTPQSSKCSERDETLVETSNWQAPADNDDEGDEEEDHVGVEELNFFEQEQNGSSESLVEALDEMFTDHCYILYTPSDGVGHQYDLWLLLASPIENYSLISGSQFTCLRRPITRFWWPIYQSLAITTGHDLMIPDLRQSLAIAISFIGPSNFVLPPSSLITMQALPPAPIYVYLSKRKQAFRLVQLPLFIGFAEHLFLIGYLAHIYRQISPLYCAEFAPDLVLPTVGVLAIAQQGDVVFHTVFEKEAGDGDFLWNVNTAFCSPNFRGLGSALWPVTLLSHHSIIFNAALFPYGDSAPAPVLHISHLPSTELDEVVPDGSILPAPLAATAPLPHVSQAPALPSTDEVFPYEPMAPAPLVAAEAAPHLHMSQASVLPSTDKVFPYGPMPFAPLAAIEAAPLLHISSAPPSINKQSVYTLYYPSITSFNGYTENSSDHPLVTAAPAGSIEDLMVVFHQALIWKGVDVKLESDLRVAISAALGKYLWNHVLFLTKCLYLGSLWVGVANPFNLSEPAGRRLISTCLLMAIDLDCTTLQYLEDNPVIVKGQETSPVRWNTLRLTFCNHIENRTSEMRKAVRACILTPTGFSGSTMEEQNARVDYFFTLLLSTHRERVQQAITEIMELQLFKELLWIALFQLMNGLCKGNRDGRIADFFPEEIRGPNGLLQKGVVGTLLTIVHRGNQDVAFLKRRKCVSDGHKKPLSKDVPAKEATKTSE
ncbi:uncharacterized protein EDB91DRAFT_1083256 [Suillus paluster]|uniref:uncharacterized protein n=1 Tax=Suillus paluster TaxID=48578 RepID=UPI001B87CE23|nr:uncharacterized protein EDB91DRAFT_1083256 [Suillus paluster]KAG1736910.1 hypothetical protein EDB91DRAFT_1083256 [Suillus paluster]